MVLTGTDIVLEVVPRAIQQVPPKPRSLQWIMAVWADSSERIDAPFQWASTIACPSIQQNLVVPAGTSSTRAAKWNMSFGR